MKTFTTPTGLISVEINTPLGRRRFSTGTTDPERAAKIIDAAHVEAVEVAVSANIMNRDMMRKLIVGGNLTVWNCILEWEVYLRSLGRSRIDNHLMYSKTWARESDVKNKLIADVTLPDINDWINRSDGCKASSKRIKLNCIRGLFKYAFDMGYINRDVSRLVTVLYNRLSHEQKEPRPRRVFTDEEYNQLVKYLEDRIVKLAPKWTERWRIRLAQARFWYCAVVISRQTGLRLGDVCGLEWGCFKTPGKLIVWTDKRDKRVVLDIMPNLFWRPDDLKADRKGRVWPGIHAMHQDSDLRPRISKQFQAILKKAGIVDHHFHELRMTKATEMFNWGVPVEQIAGQLGHSETKTTEGYILKEDKL